MKESILYKILIPLDKLFMKLYRPTIINSDIIENNKSYILAGNHTNNLDSLLVMSSTNRPLSFIAKIELFKGIWKYFFRLLHVIPVDRSKHNPEAIKIACEYLNNKGIICIFSEGTINRTDNIMLPLKKGAMRMANNTNSLVIPFCIKGEYKLFRKNIKLVYGNPIKPSGDVVEDTELLNKKIIELLRSN